MPTLTEKIISLLINPAVSGILLLILLGGIYFELQTQARSRISAYSSNNCQDTLFCPSLPRRSGSKLGNSNGCNRVYFIALEILVIPGFGVAGISGIVLVVTAFAFSMIGNDGLNFDGIPQNEIVKSFAVVMISLFPAIVVSYFLGKRMIKTNRFKKMVLHETMNASDGYHSSDASLLPLVGSSGYTRSFLRPSGKIVINEQSYSANAETGFIETNRVW